MVEHVPGVHKALSSTPSTKRQNKRHKGRERKRKSRLRNRATESPRSYEYKSLKLAEYSGALL